MCLLLAIFMLLGPRALIFFWWLMEPVRWQATFQSAFVPIIGLLFLPWTTIMYVLVFPGGIDGLDWLWLGHRAGRGHRLVRQQRLRQPRPDRVHQLRRRVS